MKHIAFDKPRRVLSGDRRPKAIGLQLRPRDNPPKRCGKVHVILLICASMSLLGTTEQPEAKFNFYFLGYRREGEEGFKHHNGNEKPQEFNAYFCNLWGSQR